MRTALYACSSGALIRQAYLDAPPRLHERIRIHRHGCQTLDPVDRSSACRPRPGRRRSGPAAPATFPVAGGAPPASPARRSTLTGPLGSSPVIGCVRPRPGGGGDRPNLKYHLRLKRVSAFRMSTTVLPSTVRTRTVGRSIAAAVSAATASRGAGRCAVSSLVCAT